jgi:F0F1-type ATP synthase assembly protein I
MRYPWLPALSLLGVGFYIAASIILGTLGGRWLDGQLKTDTTWTIIGLVLGIIAAVFGTYRMFKPFIDSAKKTDNKKDKDNQ